LIERIDLTHDRLQHHLLHGWQSWQPQQLLTTALQGKSRPAFAHPIADRDPVPTAVNTMAEYKY